MFGNGPTNTGKMQRTTAPPTFDVYRSLPVSATAVLARHSNSSVTDSVPTVAKTTDAARDAAATNDSAIQIPYPPVPIASFDNSDCLWVDKLDLDDYKGRLSAVCSKCELRRTPTTCELVCKAQAQDGTEEVNFHISIWAVPEGEQQAKGKFIVEADRTSGCAYFYRQTLQKAFGIPDNRKCEYKLFRAPRLPECLDDEGKGIHMNCVENALSLATSDVYEQRCQGVCTLAELCSEKCPAFSSMFKLADGPRRIGGLQSDPDTHIKRAVSRILTFCA